MEYLSKSLSETAGLAEKFLTENPSVNIVGLSGDLGSGKTAFVKGVAKYFGIERNITSPTFVIMKSYQSCGKCLFHIDAYRLSGLEDLESLGFSEMIKSDKNLIFIEWPEKVFKDYPENMKIIKFEYIDDETRKITF